MPKRRIKVTTPLFFDIEVDEDVDTVCGYDCPQWEEETQKGKNEMKAVCRIFGRLRWWDGELTYRHKQCLASETVKRRK